MQELILDARIIVCGDLNGHVGSNRRGCEEVHGGYGIGEVNEEGVKVLDFAVAYQFF